MELSGPISNAKKIQATKVLTSDNHAYPKQLRAKFQHRIQKLDENDTLSDLSYDEDKNKGDW